MTTLAKTEQYVGATSIKATWNAEAADYFLRQEAKGSTFDASHLNPTYHASYVKQSISNMIQGLKDDGVWDDITELYLLAGFSWPTSGEITKLKYDTVPDLTNNNFVSGDYVQAGSGAGLKGDGSTKYLGTSYEISGLGDSFAMSAYVAALGSNAGRHFMGNYSGSASPDYCGIYQSKLTQTRAELPFNDAYIVIEDPASAGILIGSRRGVNDAECYKNGSSASSDTSTSAIDSNSTPFSLFATGSGVNKTNATLTAAHIGLGLTTTQAADLSTRVNALMTSLGANVY